MVTLIISSTDLGILLCRPLIIVAPRGVVEFTKSCNREILHDIMFAYCLTYQLPILTASFEVYCVWKSVVSDTLTSNCRIDSWHRLLEEILSSVILVVLAMSSAVLSDVFVCFVCSLARSMSIVVSSVNTGSCVYGDDFSWENEIADLLSGRAVKLLVKGLPHVFDRDAGHVFLSPLSPPACAKLWNAIWTFPILSRRSCMWFGLLKYDLQRAVECLVEEILHRDREFLLELLLQNICNTVRGHFRLARPGYSVFSRFYFIRLFPMCSEVPRIRSGAPWARAKIEHRMCALDGECGIADVPYYTQGASLEMDKQTTTWDLLEKAFIGQYFPPFKTTKKLGIIRNFKQEMDETLYHAWERVLDSKGFIPLMRLTQALISIQVMVEHSHNWYDEATTRERINDSPNNIDTKKPKGNIHAIQASFKNYEGAHLTMECPLKKEDKAVEQNKYMRSLEETIIKFCENLITKQAADNEWIRKFIENTNSNIKALKTTTKNLEKKAYQLTQTVLTNTGEKVKERTTMGSLYRTRKTICAIRIPKEIKEDEGDINDGYDITVEDVERLRKILTPSIYAL
ncbi:hypothetical protein Tco_0492211 [Tanacetum coccineum]